MGHSINMTSTLVFMRQAFAHLSVSVCVGEEGRLANTHTSDRYVILPCLLVSAGEARVVEQEER